MKFQNNVINKNVAAAIIDAERLLHPDSKMMQELKLKNDFKYNSGTGVEVYNRVINCDVVAPVFTYRPFWFRSKVLGYADGKAIYLNLYKLDKLNHAELVGLLLHEWLHLGPKFGHGNNYKTKDKVNFSVNYFVSENVGKWL